MWIPSTRAVESGVREGNTAAVYSQLATLDPGSSSRELQLRKRIHRGFQYGTSCGFVGFDEKQADTTLRLACRHPLAIGRLHAVPG